MYVCMCVYMCIYIYILNEQVNKWVADNLELASKLSKRQACEAWRQVLFSYIYTYVHT